MRTLALSDEILLKVDKPARYIGNEVNAVMKNKEEIDIRFAFVFPDVYEIGMSHLGIQILYDMLNRRDDIWCERVYSPWTDLDQIMREEKIPLFSLLKKIVKYQSAVAASGGKLQSKGVILPDRKFRLLHRRIQSKILLKHIVPPQ